MSLGPIEISASQLRNISKWNCVRIPPQKGRYEIVKVTGNCCWRVSSRYIGGRYEDLEGVGVFATGWAIKRVILTDCGGFSSTAGLCARYSDPSPAATPPIKSSTEISPVTSTATPTVKGIFLDFLQPLYSICQFFSCF